MTNKKKKQVNCFTLEFGIDSHHLSQGISVQNYSYGRKGLLVGDRLSLGAGLYPNKQQDYWLYGIDREKPPVIHNHLVTNGGLVKKTNPNGQNELLMSHSMDRYPVTVLRIITLDIVKQDKFGGLTRSSTNGLELVQHKIDLISGENFGFYDILIEIPRAKEGHLTVQTTSGQKWKINFPSNNFNVCVTQKRKRILR